MLHVIFQLIWVYMLRVAFASDEPATYVLDFPTQNNPMNITISSSAGKNYFMLIGDWGAASATDEKVQEAIAEKMLSLYNTRKSEGYNLLFVATVGDNFYYSGQTCQYYTDRWTDIYQELATDYPWLAVFGNHDWGDNDPDAICAWGSDDIKYTDPKTNIPYAANQINADKKGCNPSNYYLPDFGYYYTINELSFEAIFLEETATICPDDMGGQTYKSCDDSSKIGCEYLGKMQNASENMLIQRAKESTNTNFLIIQHYPDNSDRLLTLFKDNRVSKSDSDNDSDNDIVWSAYGHAHRQECEHYSDEAKTMCDSILTGGGGGCCSDVSLRGFFVIDFDENGQMAQPYKYDDSTISCEYPCRADFSQLTPKEIEQSKFEHCCHLYEEEKCSMFDMSQCRI